MSAASCVLSEEQFLCPICLDVFTNPVALQCGHNFCRNCITEHWDVNEKCECPLCKRMFHTRPELYVNTFISEMAAQFRQSAAKKTRNRSVWRSSSSGEVLCDVCTETKQMALKSCLMCLASYCDTHLEPHHRIPGLKQHELIDPIENMEDRMCKKHEKLLEMFCKTDQTCVCISCAELDHKLHSIVPLTEQYEVKAAELRETVADFQEMIQVRWMKIQEMLDSVKLSREDADLEKSDGIQVFTVLIRSVQEALAQLLDLIEKKHKNTKKQAHGFIKELQKEISELWKRSAAMEQLLHTEDHLQFLQNIPFLSPAPPTKDWTEVRVHSSYEGTVRSAVAQIEETVSEEVRKQFESELKRVQQFAVDVTLDPDTAHPNLILSDDKKKVHYGKKTNLPKNPGRFYFYRNVLGEQGYSGGKFYFEVQVKEKNRWEFGVTRESMSRKEKVMPGQQTGPWMLLMTSGDKYKALSHPSVPLSLKSKLQKVGVFVDYEEGLVSFYDADTAALIYSFTGCDFTDKLYPIFGPCDNSSGDNAAPLVLTPVNQRVRSRF